VAHHLPEPPDSLATEVSTLLLQARSSESLAEGLAHTQTALARATEMADARARTYASFYLAFFLYRSGRLDEMIELGVRIEVELERDRAFQERMLVLSWICLGAGDRGRPEMMLRYATEAYRFGERYQDLKGRALGLNMLGVSFDRIGDPWQGLRLLRTAVERARTAGDERVLASTLNNQSATMMSQARLMRAAGMDVPADALLREAIVAAREVEAIISRLGEKFFQTFTFANLGEMLVSVGEVEEGALYIDRSIAQAREHRYLAIYVQAMATYARICLLRSEANETLRIVDELTNEHWSELPPFLHGLIELLRADAYSALGRERDAIASWRKLREIESMRVYAQLQSQSDLFVTRLEADSHETKQVQRAFEIVREHASKAQQMEYMALHDELTVLGNRRLLDKQLPEMLTQAKTTGARISVVVVDIDHFKSVNDRFGHRAGDQVLRIFASLLQQSTRETDFVCRVGGEEFVVVLPGLDATRAFDLCDRLRLQIQRYSWGTLADGLRITASMGVASAPEYEMQELLDRADAQLYVAKRGGRNRVSAAG
jgi:diguanylate cyclase (GGDEF)-like protein